MTSIPDRGNGVSPGHHCPGDDIGNAHVASAVVGVDDQELEASDCKGQGNEEARVNVSNTRFSHDGINLDMLDLNGAPLIESE